MNAIQQLAQNNTGVVGILSTLVLVMFAVIIYQWKHTKDNTVPKDIYKDQSAKFDKLAEVSSNGFSDIGKGISELTATIRERLNK